MGISSHFPFTPIGAALATAVAVACSGATKDKPPTTQNHAVITPAVQTPPARPAEPPALGTVDFPVSCDAGVQAEFEQALALLHHMMYAQAFAAFETIAERDSNCAMAHWGIAMSLFHPLWADPPTPEELERGALAVARAREIQPQTERERGFIEAVAAYYEDGQVRDEGQRLARFECAARKLHQRQPDDPDAAAFHALALLATAPSGDPTYVNQRRAIALLSEVHDRLPRHPGAIHYGIHAHDSPPLAAEGVYLADVYESIAPDVPHALHMPSHIFVRLGDWRKTAEWNRRSADAAVRQSVGGQLSIHYAHAMDYMMYAYLQRIQDQRAAEVIREFDATTGYEMSPAAAYAIAAVHARLPVEQHDWERAAALTTDAIPVDIPWDEFGYAKAVVVYAAGLGAARSGDIEAATQALAELDDIVQTLAVTSQDQSALRYWHIRTQVQRDTVAAWIAHARGDQSEARQLLSLAAEREELAGKHAIMPGFILPARELLGDMLLEQGRPGPALQAYQASLRESPRRANSLRGAARAAELLDDRRTALNYSVQLAVMALDADAQRPILRETLDYLEGREPSKGSGR